MFENPTADLNALYNSCENIKSFLAGLIFVSLYAGSSIQNASEHFVGFIPLSFVNFALHPNSQTKI
jgi:hypothetical protein